MRIYPDWGINLHNVQGLEKLTPGKRNVCTLEYSCRATSKALPKATVTVEPKWLPLYTGETVNLKCGVDSYSNWSSLWFKGQLKKAQAETADHLSVSGDRYTITVAAGTDQGQYWCAGLRDSRPRSSQHSAPVTLIIKGRS
ncbi:hypothetical protein SKAU_G00276510 [Synaphobranchus kaupii]|uniref:Ig-like domain-containing protein n=1 Tax=Synaphobranchus kaupii TaxID=118154 RepID=A0A9Q1F1C4_SYNKA|nr:hypothetical protein SKAU_G00276510 [Synaphobranchus kaupii]